MLYQAGCRGNIPGMKTGNPGAALKGAGHLVPTRLHFSGEYEVDIDEHPVHPTTSTGKRISAIPMFEVIKGAELDFETRILRQPAHLPEDVYTRLWYLGQEEGLGSRRDLDHGKFTLLAIESVN